jgi:hypothetical protein
MVEAIDTIGYTKAASYRIAIISRAEVTIAEVTIAEVTIAAVIGKIVKSIRVTTEEIIAIVIFLCSLGLVVDANPKAQ